MTIRSFGAKQPAARSRPMSRELDRQKRPASDDCGHHLVRILVVLGREKVHGLPGVSRVKPANCERNSLLNYDLELLVRWDGHSCFA